MNFNANKLQVPVNGVMDLNRLLTILDCVFQNQLMEQMLANVVDSTKIFVLNLGASVIGVIINNSAMIQIMICVGVI